MSTETNKQMVLDLFTALGSGNAEGFLALLDDRVQWTIRGTTKFSGLFDGKADAVNRLLGPLGAALEGPIVIAVDRMTAEGDRVVVEGRGKATTKDGKSYDNEYCWVYRMGGGKIVEINEYLDSELVTAAFGR